MQIILTSRNECSDRVFPDVILLNLAVVIEEALSVFDRLERPIILVICLRRHSVRFLGRELADGLHTLHISED